MNKKTKEELQLLVDQATAGDKKDSCGRHAGYGIQFISSDAGYLCGCGGRRPGYSAENDYPLILFQRRQLIYNLGVPYCGESSEKL